MLTTDPSPNPIEINVYAQSQKDIRQLKGSFPEGLVASLAREVILRFAARDTEIPNTIPAPSEEEIAVLCSALISDDDTAAATIITAVRAKGVPVETIYVKYLAEAARMLGEWWDNDQVTFVEVTYGTGRMVAIMRAMRHLFTPALNTEDRSAVFASVPGEVHTLGVRMAADIFVKDGWDIALKVGLDHDALIAELEKTSFRVIGLSLGGRHSVDALSRLVIALQICCPQAHILVCGHVTDEIKPLVALMGVDGIANDIAAAKEQMSALWESTCEEPRLRQLSRSQPI